MARKAPRLSRHRPKREPKRRFILYCEGSNTERDYFEALKRLFSATLIEVEIHGGAGVPQTLAEKAIAKAKEIRRSKRKEKNLFEEKDEVWAVFDRDTHPNYDNAVSLCTANGVKVGRSNPCFELWLILHIENFDRPDTHTQVQRHLRGLKPEYDPQRRKTLNCTELISAVTDAEYRAQRQLANRDQQGVPHGRPSTTVFELSRAIRKAADEAS